MPGSSSHTGVWEFILQKMKVGIPVILMYVLESKGSSPGRQGFKMAVAADNSFYGTIGGGIMEYKFVEMARSNFNGSKNNERVIRQVHDKSSSQQSGMICSGEQTIFVYPVSEKDRVAIENMIASLNHLSNGRLQLSPDGILFDDNIPDADYRFTSHGNDFLLVEKTGYKHNLHIIGGGHCSLALCKLIQDLDFHVQVYDDRKDLSTMNMNLYAHRKHWVDDYDDLEKLISGGGRDYVLIMTFGYRTDDKAFRALMKKEFQFLGMLGSKNKIKKLLESYREEKIEEKYLSRLVAPVGYPIKSETTAEIAISIASQLIAVKNAL